MRRDLEPQEIAELRAEAAEARALAGTFQCDKTVQDLLGYASELDTQAAELEQNSLQPLQEKDPAGPVPPLETLDLSVRRLPVVIRG